MVNLPKDSGGSSQENVKHNASYSQISHCLKRNENSFKAAVVNGNCTDKKASAKDVSLVNGKCNKFPAKEVANGHTLNKTSSIVKFNGYCNKIPAEEASIPNGKSKEVLVKNIPAIPTTNANFVDEVPAEKVPLQNDSENYLNGSTIPPENGISSNFHTADSLSNKDNFDELGFIEVINKKKRNKNRSKNHRKRPISNQPPGHNSTNIRHNSGSDKNCGEKASPTHSSQKQPSTFVSVKSTEKSYSSVLVNGQNGNKISKLRNGGPKISDIHTVTNYTESSKCVNNTSLPGTCISIDQLTTDITRSVIIDDTSAVSCKQSSFPKVEMTDVSAQTEVFSPDGISSSQNKCLTSSHDVVYESETHSPSDYVDVGDVSDVSSNAAYCESVASNDSGRGDSEIFYDGSAPYCCEFPSEKTSQLIGRKGSFKNEIEKNSGIQLWVYPHEFDKEMSIVCMIGTGAQIEKAKMLIKKRFPQVTLKQWIGLNSNNPPLSDNYLPVLPQSTTFMGVISCICDPNFFWLQQYGHPHFYSLEDLERRMSTHFNTFTDAPGIDNPTIGSIVAVPASRVGDNLKWIRGCIISLLPEEENLVVRYLDHGGDHLVPFSSIRPMRHDFFSMPFFAAQCCLYDILPIGGVWSDEARAEFTRLCDSSITPPIVSVMCRAPDCYYVTMHAYDAETNKRVDIASHLISKGLGLRPPIPATEFPTEIQQ